MYSFHADLAFISDYNPPKDSKEEKPDSPTVEDELAVVEKEDAASLLEALDSEVSMMVSVYVKRRDVHVHYIHATSNLTLCVCIDKYFVHHLKKLYIIL